VDSDRNEGGGELTETSDRFPSADAKLDKALEEFDRKRSRGSSLAVQPGAEDSKEPGSSESEAKSSNGFARSLKELSEAERRREVLWAESVRRYNLGRAADRRAAWVEYHRQQAARHRATLEQLIQHHEAAVLRLTESIEGG
jgi:hypothetical protein